METFSALLALCAGKSPVTGEFSARPVTRSFGISFELCLYKRFSKQSWGWWFETPSYPLWRHCNEQELSIQVYLKCPVKRILKMRVTKFVEFIARALFITVGFIVQMTFSNKCFWIKSHCISLDRYLSRHLKHCWPKPLTQYGVGWNRMPLGESSCVCVVELNFCVSYVYLNWQYIHFFSQNQNI